MPKSKRRLRWKNKPYNIADVVSYINPLHGFACVPISHRRGNSPYESSHQTRIGSLFSKNRRNAFCNSEAELDIELTSVTKHSDEFIQKSSYKSYGSCHSFDGNTNEVFSSSSEGLIITDPSDILNYSVPFEKKDNVVPDSIGSYAKSTVKSAVHNISETFEDPLKLKKENSDMQLQLRLLQNQIENIKMHLVDSELSSDKMKRILAYLDIRYTKLKDERLGIIFEYERQIAVKKKKNSMMPPNRELLMTQHKRRCIEFRNRYRIAVLNNGGEELSDEEDIIDSIGSIKELSQNERKPGLECPNCNRWWDVDEMDFFQIHTYDCAIR